MPSILIDPNGPDWPLGFIEVITPGTPVQVTSLVDPTNTYDPASTKSEYTRRVNQMMFQGYTPDTHGMKPNAGYVYIVRKGGSRDDPGTIVKVLAPGETFFLAPTPMVRDVFSPYRYYIDGDNAGDGALVTCLIF